MRENVMVRLRKELSKIITERRISAQKQSSLGRVGFLVGKLSGPGRISCAHRVRKSAAAEPLIDVIMCRICLDVKLLRYACCGTKRLGKCNESGKTIALKPQLREIFFLYLWKE
jgi:hypothetical protein